MSRRGQKEQEFQLTSQEVPVMAYGMQKKTNLVPASQNRAPWGTKGLLSPADGGYEAGGYGEQASAQLVAFSCEHHGSRRLFVTLCI